MTKHNKKRNVGLVYEMLLNYIVENIMDGKQNLAKKATKIIERRFNKSTELYKEFRLFNAIANSTVSGTHIAAGILCEAKEAARRINQAQLNKEKSLLIKDINYQLSDKYFFHRTVKEYRTYATIQTLLNEWSKNDKGDLSKIIAYEKNIVEHLIDDSKNKISESRLDDHATDRLVFDLLTKKINEKYESSLTLEQKEILRNYAIYSDDLESLKGYLEDLKTNTVETLKEYKSSTDNIVLLSKIDNVINNVKSLQTEHVDDQCIKKFLTVSSLKQQLDL